MHPPTTWKVHLLHYKPFTVCWFFPVHGFQLKVIGEEFIWIPPPERVDIRHLESSSLLRRDTTPPHQERGIRGIPLFLYGQLREIFEDTCHLKKRFQRPHSGTYYRRGVPACSAKVGDDGGLPWCLSAYWYSPPCGCVWKFLRNLLSHTWSRSCSLL